ALGRQSLVDAVPAADTDRVRALLDRVYHTGEAGLDGDPPPIDAARDQVYWTYSVWPILDAHGRPAGLVLLIRATTAHHHDAQALRDTGAINAQVLLAQAVLDTRAVNEQVLLAGLREQTLAVQLQRQLAFTTAITASLGEGLYTFDRAGRFTMANPAAERLLGWSEAELLGRDMHE